MKKALLLLFLSSCATASHWQGWERRCATPSHSYAEMAFNSEAVELRFRKGSYGLHGYLSVREGVIPSADYWLVVEGEEPIQSTGRLLEGGQRLLLDEAVSVKLIDLLNEGRSFDLRLPPYSATITDHKFTKRHKRFSAVRTTQ